MADFPQAYELEGDYIMNGPDIYLAELVEGRDYYYYITVKCKGKFKGPSPSGTLEFEPDNDVAPQGMISSWEPVGE